MARVIFFVLIVTALFGLTLGEQHLSGAEDKLHQAEVLRLVDMKGGLLLAA